MADSPRATSEWTLWVVAVSCGLHAVEEYFTGWQEWAPQALSIVMPSGLFITMNALLVAAALNFARLGWRRPELSLMIPVATLVNGIFFHILPTIVQMRRAPGVYTAVLLYLPFSSWALVGGVRDGVPRAAIATATAAGVVFALGVVIGARWLTSASYGG